MALALAPSGIAASYIAVDHAGRIYYYDDDHSISRIDDMTGVNRINYNPTDQFGAHTFNGTNGIAIDSTNRIYLISGSRVLRMDDMAGTNLVTLGFTGTGPNHFRNASSIAIDAANRIYVADAGNHQIVRFDDMTGTNWTTFAIPSEVGSTTIAMDGVAIGGGTTQYIYFTDANNSKIYRMNDMTGAGIVSYGSKGSGDNQYTFPTALAAK